MASQLKLSEFQGASGNWYIACTDYVGTVYNQWWYIPKALGMSLPAFVTSIVKDYKADNVSFDGKTFVFSWAESNQTLARKYKNNINKLLREKKITI